MKIRAPVKPLSALAVFYMFSSLGCSGPQNLQNQKGHDPIYSSPFLNERNSPFETIKDNFERGYHFLGQIKQDSDCYLEAIFCINQLSAEKRYEEAHYIINQIMMGHMPKKENVLMEFNLAAATTYYPWAQQLERQGNYLDAGVYYVYASLHYGRIGENELRKKMLQERKRMMENKK
ncbi:hypothetical protein KO465_06055 [Candidatus Micrarchaeota archaeon]|nr:hypothetical protein [Candidatus Micrarchaeota archaeon]